MTTILIDSAELAGLAIAGPLYGIFACLFLVCSYDLRRRRIRHGTHLSWPTMVAGVMLIVLATARFMVDVTYIFVAFIHQDTREGRLAFLQDVSSPLFITKHSLFTTSLLVGDLFVNYRCWVIWNKKTLVIIVPVILSFLASGSSYYALWGFMHLTDQSIFAQQRALKIFFSSSLGANAVATSLLASRIWWMDRNGSRALNEMDGTGYKLHPVVRIILESGLLNAAFLFAFVMTLAFGSSSLEIMSEMGTPMCGIVFSIVIFRVGTQRQSSVEATLPTLSWNLAPKSRETRCGRSTGVTGTTAADPKAAMPTIDATLQVSVQQDTTRRQEVFDVYKLDESFNA